MPEFAIQTNALQKNYGAVKAVRGLSLEVRRGEVFGFLGPNGSGKTTSIKMLLGLVSPTAGSALLLGKRPSDVSVRSKAGFLPEHFRFHEWLTGEEFLRVHGRLYGIASPALEKKVNDLLERVNLGSFRGQQLRTYSKGMLQRIGLAQALLNDPEIVFLDEPTSGLDPVGRRMVRDIIREVRAKGATVFLNSHLLSEVEITCDRVAFIKHGEVLRTMALAEVSEEQSAKAQFLEVVIRAAPLPEAVVQGLAQFGAAQSNGDGSVILKISAESDLPEIARYLVAQGAGLYELTPRRISLEELFLEIVGTDGGL